jgi:hypothetical protein
MNASHADRLIVRRGCCDDWCARQRESFLSAASYATCGSEALVVACRLRAQTDWPLMKADCQFAGVSVWRLGQRLGYRGGCS